MSSEIAIAVNGVSKRYEIYAQPRDRLLQFLSFGKRKYYREFWALRDISFTVQKGETIGILGRNGSGKSTLLQIIAGTLSPTAGEVSTQGVMAALLELGSGFNPDFTGRENIYLNGSILGLSRAEMEARFDEIAAFADIGEHLDQPIKTYSSGMAVRLAFAVQACVSPQVLIVDEALSVGDEKFQRKCFDHIERLREGGCSILLVTHSTATVEKFCQRGVLLHKGAVHGIGPAKEIVDQYHALLYSDESTYLRYIAKTAPQGAPTSTSTAHAASQNAPSQSSTHINTAPPEGARAVISHWQVLDTTGQPCEQYRTGDHTQISYTVSILGEVRELQAGILIRTLEGVSVFGTSTLYSEQNVTGLTINDQVQFDFDLRLNLCEGTYFVTLAIAEAISHGDMSYLDRKTDVIVIKVYQPRTKASGIAMLDAAITTHISSRAAQASNAGHETRDAWVPDQP
ncbi:ABC transporter, ATP-binding subunit [gamma proteobacterium HdN1]|nr:ABC transporter, ATP-binding subunit [gamma proteobacterium HdN1]